MSRRRTSVLLGEGLNSVNPAPVAPVEGVASGAEVEDYVGDGCGCSPPGCRAAVTSSAVSAASSGTGPTPLSAAQAAALSNNVTQRVIVVLKDQVSQFPSSRALIKSRSAVVNSLQAPILGDLTATKAHNVHSYTTINAVSATVSPGEAARLAADPAVAESFPTRSSKLASPFDAAATPSATGSASRTPPAGTCPAKGAPPLLEPRRSVSSTPTPPLRTPGRPAPSGSTARV